MNARRSTTATTLRLHRGAARRQRGVAALVVATLLAFALALVVAFTQRQLVVEQRTSANQYRATQAFAAAEAGLEWALAQLNRGAALGDDCLPDASAGAASFRDRHLAWDASTASLAPVTWSDAGTPRPLQAACRRDGDGWQCSCPASGAPVLAAAADAAVHPAFDVAFSAGPRPGLVRVVATGCTRSTGVCPAAGAAVHEATARVEALLGLVPALRAAPVAALTVGGALDAGSAALGVAHAATDVGGLALHAGGPIAAPSLRVVAAPGAPSSDAVVGTDAALATLAASSPDALFARHFGMTAAAWGAQPAATRLSCSDDCTPVVAAAVAAGATLVFVAGDLTLAGPLALGSAARPVAIVAGGDVHLSGAVAIRGVLAGRHLDWSDAAVDAGATVRGAAAFSGHYGGDAAADFVHEPDALARLQGANGSFVRVNGSWKDF